MLPLQGIRVVEFGSMISVPYAATLLAEMGAEVIKVELAPKGDFSRGFGAFRALAGGERHRAR